MRVFKLLFLEDTWQVWEEGVPKPWSSEPTLEAALKAAYPQTGALTLDLQQVWL